MFEIFAFFAELSWLTIAIVSFGVICIGGLIHDDDAAGVDLVFVVTVSALAGVYVWDHSFAGLWAFIKTLPEYLPYIVAYLVIGVVWSIIKWASFIREKAVALTKALDKLRDEWENRKAQFGDRLDASIEMYVEKIVDRINASFGSLAVNSLKGSDLIVEDKAQLDPVFILEKLDFTASHKKGTIIAWICYWPISLLSTFFREMIIGLIENIFKFFQSSYNRISKSIFYSAVSKAVAAAQTEKEEIAKAKSEAAKVAAGAK